MFCGECGTKNAKNAKFCEKCGAKLEVEEAPVEKKTTSKANAEKKETTKNVTETKPAKKGLSKTVKWIIIGSSIFVALLITFIIWGSIVTKPSHIVENFMKAFASEDYEEMYEYVVEEPTGDSTFVSKSAFANIMKNNAPKKIANYTVGNTTYDVGGLVATVPVSYTYTDSKSANDVKFSLTDSGKNTMLFFTKWKLTGGFTSSANLVKDYTIKVPKGAKLEYAGISVDKSYLDKDESNSTMDAYKLSQVFNIKTSVKTTLESGIVIEEKVTPSTYSNTHTVRLTSSNVSQKFKDELVTEGKNDLNTWYKAITEEKGFDTLDSKKFDSKTKDQFEKDFKYIQTDSKKLTKFNITKADFSSLSTTDDGYIRVFFKITYDYTVSYKDGEEMKTKDKNSYDYVYLTYDTTGKTKKLMAVSSLPTYFSRY